MQLHIRKRTPFYRMRLVMLISLVLTIVLLLLLLFFYMTTIQKNAGTMVSLAKGKPVPDAALTEEVLFMARNGKGMVFRPSLLKSEQYGYDAKQNMSLRPLKVISLQHNLFGHHYLFSADTLILLGDFNIVKIRSFHETSRVVIMDYEGSFFHIRKVGDGIRILEEEADSAIIGLCRD